MKRTALVILASLFLVTSATAFTQGHPLSQIFGESGTFADCGDQVLAGNGSCVSVATSSSGDSGTDDQELLGFERSDGEVTLSLEDGGTATFTDETGSSSGSGDGYVGNEREFGNPHMIRGPLEFGDRDDWGIWGAHYVASRGSVSGSSVQARTEFCLGGESDDSCITDWSEVFSGEDRPYKIGKSTEDVGIGFFDYAVGIGPEGGNVLEVKDDLVESFSNLDMNTKNIENLDKLKFEGRYGGVTLQADSGSLDVGQDIKMNGNEIDNVKTISFERSNIDHGDSCDLAGQLKFDDALYVCQADFGNEWQKITVKD